MIFEKGKIYRFRKSLFILDLGLSEKCLYTWLEECKDKQVDIVDTFEGNIEGYIIRPEWCEEITDDID